MTIKWLGSSTIELTEKKQKAVLNAQNDAQAQGSQILIYDRTDEKHKAPEGGLLIDWPGEYDTAGYSFRGIEYHGKKSTSIAYVFHQPEGNVAWLGEMSEYPNEAFIKALGEVHVLLVPVGDKDVLKAKDAFRLVEELEPMVVIPICFGGEREGLQAFLKEMDVKHPDAQKSFELKKSALSEENMELVILEEA